MFWHDVQTFLLLRSVIFGVACFYIRRLVTCCGAGKHRKDLTGMQRDAVWLNSLSGVCFRFSEDELRRFHMAANGDLSILVSSVKKTIRWRETFHILTLQELEKWSHLVFWHGFDTTLRPCLVIRLGLACSSIAPRDRPCFGQAVGNFSTCFIWLSICSIVIFLVIVHHQLELGKMGMDFLLTLCDRPYFSIMRSIGPLLLDLTENIVSLSAIICLDVLIIY